MPELRIPIDPTNPGWFYSCCGILQLAELRGEQPLSRFELSPRQPRQAQFIVADTSLDITQILNMLRTAASVPLQPDDSTSVVELTVAGHTLRLNWWRDHFELEANDFKTWAGQLSSAKIFAEIPAMIGDSLTAPVITKTKAGLDPRSSWEALDIGFSPNEHSGAQVYPAVELLASLGLHKFRPLSHGRRKFSYSLWTAALPPLVCRTLPWPGFDAVSVNFSFHVTRRGSYKYFAFAKLQPNS
jgi:CRISPR-associated protein Csx14